MTSNLTEFKLAVVGAGGSGKSALTVQYIMNKFVHDYDPTIEDTYRKLVKFGDETIVIHITDTAGQEEYVALRDGYMRSAHGFLIVYDITKSDSFLEVDNFVQHILRVKDVDSFPMVLVGNKSDLEAERQVKRFDAEQYAKTVMHGAPYIEASARMRKNVDESYDLLVKQMVLHKRQSGSSSDTPKKRKRSCNIM